MTDIDIGRLKLQARYYKDKAMLALIERLEKAEAQRDQLAKALMRMVDRQGVDCEDPECPADDTCRCTTPALVNSSLAYLTVETMENKTDDRHDDNHRRRDRAAYRLADVFR